MRRVGFSDGAPATNELAVARFERALSVRFPEDDRAILSAANGGRPSPACLRFDFAGEATAFHVHFLFGVDDPVTACDLKWNADRTREIRTPEFLPIASDDFGGLFHPTVRGPRVGEVLFGGLLQDGIVHYGRVAGSFNAFLAMLEDAASE